MRAILTLLSEPCQGPDIVTSVRVSFQKGAKRLSMDDSDEVIIFRTPDVLDHDGLREAILGICNFAKAELATSLVFDFSNINEHVKMTKFQLGSVLGEFLVNESYTFDNYKKDKGYPGLESITVEMVPTAFVPIVERSAVIGGGIVKARDLCNTPANDLGPLDLLAYAAELTALGDGSVINKSFNPRLPAEDDDILGLVVGVGQGAVRDSSFIVLEYWGDDSTKDISVVAIGKGVCFDTGGLSMKSPENMLGMHHDMGGAAAVLASLETVIRRKLKVNIVAIVPAVENSVSEYAIRPGDILKSMSGLTVEVGNTDAEGRLILADALSFAGKHYPNAALYVDFATLTGAACVALGSSFSGLFTTNDKLAEAFLFYTRNLNDPLWRLPIGGEFRKLLDSKVADLNNVQAGSSKNGGASIGASFLSEFAEKAGIVDRHVHVDIAPRMTGPDGLSQGAGTRLLISVIQGFAELPKT